MSQSTPELLEGDEGTEGATGNGTGVHLHFQIATPDAPAHAPTLKYLIDPVPFLKSKGVP